MDFHGIKRKKLQALCKKHGIPANLKNVEMANRLSTLFQDQTSPVRSQTTSDIPSGCSVTESQQDGASVDDDESLVLNKTDETLVTSEYNTVEEQEEEEMEIGKEGCMSVGHCVSNPESELGIPTEMELLLSANRHGDLSEYNTHESSSAEEQSDICKVGHCVRDTLDGSSVLGESAVFTTPERNLMMMEQLSPDGKTRAAESVNHQSVEAVESYGVVFTTPEQVLLLGDCGLDEEATEEEHTATESPEDSVVKRERDGMELKDESVFFTRFESCLLLGEPTQGRPDSGKPVSSRHDSSAKVIMKDDIVVWGSHISALDLGDNTIADSRGSMTSRVSEETAGAENVAGLNATQGTSKESKVNSPQVDSVTDIEGAETIMECNPESEIVLETTPSPSLVQSALSLPTGPIHVKETVSTLTAEEDTQTNEETVAKLAEAEAVLENSTVNLTLSTNSAASSVLGESDVFTNPERNLMMLEQLSQKEKTRAADSVNHHSDEAVESPGLVFTTPEQVLLLGDDSVLDEEGMQVDCDNITGASVTTKSHDMSDLLAASESPSIMGDFEPFTAKKQKREKVEFKDQSAFFTRFETCLLLGESGSSHHDSSAKVIVKDDSVVRGSHVPALDLGDNTVAGSGCSITSKVFSSHEFNAGEETAGADFISKDSQAEYVDSANLYDLDIEGADTIMDAERNVSFSGHVLAGTCSLVPDDLIQTKATTQRDDMLDCSGGSSVPGKI